VLVLVLVLNTKSLVSRLLWLANRSPNSLKLLSPHRLNVFVDQARAATRGLSSLVAWFAARRLHRRVGRHHSHVDANAQELELSPPITVRGPRRYGLFRASHRFPSPTNRVVRRDQRALSGWFRDVLSNNIGCP
jgi:hypothetical protein